MPGRRKADFPNEGVVTLIFVEEVVGNRSGCPAYKENADDSPLPAERGSFSRCPNCACSMAMSTGERYWLCGFLFRLADLGSDGGVVSTLFERAPEQSLQTIPACRREYVLQHLHGLFVHAFAPIGLGEDPVKFTSLRCGFQALRRVGDGGVVLACTRIEVGHRQGTSEGIELQSLSSAASMASGWRLSWQESWRGDGRPRRVRIELDGALDLLISSREDPSRLSQ